MKDRVFLVLAALIVAAAAWSFWHYLGADAWPVLLLLLLLALVSVSADNYRLRRLLRRSGSTPA
jgi:hypothetical protein